MLEQGFSAMADDRMSRLEFVCEYIFEIATYETEAAEFFAHKALDVCDAISKRTTFDYIEDLERKRWYLAIVNMPFFKDKITWGTSIRGAWWAGKINLDSCGLWLDGEQIIATLCLYSDEWEAFLAALSEFAKGPAQ